VLRKPSLNAVSRKRHLNFAHWALEQLDNENIFIFFDKTYIEIGEIHEKTQVSHIHDQNSNEFAEPQQKKEHTFMF